MEKMINVAEACEALTNKPMFATSVERVFIMESLQNAYQDQPQPIRAGRILQDFLSRVSVPLETYDRFAGRCVDRELTAEEEERFQAFLKSNNVYRTAIFSTGHGTLCWDELAKMGLVGLKARAQEQLTRQTEEDKKIFLQGAVLTYDALIAFVLRYGEQARSKGMTELADCMQAIATRAPSSFYEALQLCWLVAFVDCAYVTPNPTLTLGRLDQVLIGFYRADLQSGKLTEREAKELITDYYCKHNLMMGRGEHQVGEANDSTTFERIFNFDAPQYLELAGTDEAGNPAVNELTYLFASCIQPSFKNPVVVVRYFKEMNVAHPDLWRILCDKARDSASMMIYNDTDIIEAIRFLGLPEETARKYEHFGCNWCSLGVDSAWINIGPSARAFYPEMSEEERKLLCVPYDRCNSPYGWPHDFMDNLISRKQQGMLPASTEEVYDLFFDSFEAYLRNRFARLSLEIQVRKRRPSAVFIYGDCFLPKPILRAQSSAASGSDWFFELQSLQGLGTIIDSIFAIDEIVFRRKLVDFATLIEATQADFVGYEELLAHIRKLEFWGSDSERSNAHAAKFVSRFADTIASVARPYTEKEGIVLMTSLQSDTWHLKYGEMACATPNGRRAHAPYSQNCKPTDSACVNGISGMLNSLNVLPFRKFCSGAVNLDIQPSDYEGEKGLDNLCALLGTYFNRGGLQVQVSSVDVNTLKDAQVHPADHKDLRVRVTGYSGVFVDIAKKLQDDIISRMS